MLIFIKINNIEIILNLRYNNFKYKVFNGDWGLGIGDWEI